MTPGLFLVLSLAGGAGAATRFWADGVIRSRLTSAVPWATMIINATGSLLMGLLIGLTATSGVPGGLSLVLGTGFLGGYTTFSTASYETVQLLRQERYAAAVASGVGALLVCVALAGLGLWLGSQL
ncbi:fluoride efflux transporter CrcB [Sanguibacter suarezii]|uniref:fluoride efflux transporter CrcB n=1 Tax=Sanguibacter suarezii TaxID=60921 RepID=UPI000836D869|nr:fluoride efflux transporter CrcB [Sanguibacter suarezii]